jgi:hypothetical protein
MSAAGAGGEAPRWDDEYPDRGEIQAERGH